MYTENKQQGILNTTSNNMSQKRIEFIDLAKGICIILVVLGHCGARINLPGLEIVRMPLYFILSGLFFKDYGGGYNFFIRKTNKILIPFIFFYLLGCMAYYGIKFLAPQLLITSAGGILDVFNNRQFFNGPIWFLLCLFWCNIIFCQITLHIKREWLRIITVIALGVTGLLLGRSGVFIPLFIDVAFTALPFFAFGYYLKKSDILYPNRYDRYCILFAMVFWGIAYILTITTDYRLSLHYNVLEGWSTYFISITSVLAILFLCKTIKHVPFVSYCGRYSIVLLCVHHMIYRPLMVLMPKTGIEILSSNWSIAIITLLLSAACIPVCKKLIPWFVAQKDLIKLPQKGA